MKKNLFLSLAAVAVMALGLTSCGKTGNCTCDGVKGTSYSTKGGTYNKTLYDAAKQSCELAASENCKWVVE